MSDNQNNDNVFTHLLKAGQASLEMDVKTTWDHLKEVPGGKKLFSYIAGTKAPYTWTVRPEVDSLSKGRAQVSITDRKDVRNHLNSIHAMALGNLTEFTANLALMYTMPEKSRFIVKKFDIEYRKKARGTIRAVADCPPITNINNIVYEIPVSLYATDTPEGEQSWVAHANVYSLVSPKK